MPTNQDEPDAVAQLQARTHELESRYTYLQRTMEALNEVVIEQGRKIDRLERHLAAFTKQFGSLTEREHERRSPEDEKPPHY